MQIFSAFHVVFSFIHRHWAFLGGINGVMVSGLSLEQLITVLLLIVNELSSISSLWKFGPLRVQLGIGAT